MYVCITQNFQVNPPELYLFLLGFLRKKNQRIAKVGRPAICLKSVIEYI